jgi:serine/threonine-protein kinase RsbW
MADLQPLSGIGVVPIKQIFDLTFGSELLNVKQVVKKILYFLQGAFPALSHEEQTDLKLVFSELLYNAVVHGNKSDAQKNVHLNVEIDDDMVIGRISDEGNGFDYAEILDSLGDGELFSERGRGIRLVSSLTDKIAFNVSGNAIRFCKRVAADG